MTRFNEFLTNHFCCDRRSTVSLKENGKRYTANNILKKTVAQYHIDTSSTPPKKCDYALYIFDNENPLNDDNRVIFVELKGSDILQAIKQISQSINDFVVLPNIKCRALDARIVASRSPNPRYYETAHIKLNMRLRSFGGSNLKIGTNGNFEENI